MFHSFLYDYQRVIGGFFIAHSSLVAPSALNQRQPCFFDSGSETIPVHTKKVDLCIYIYIIYILYIYINVSIIMCIYIYM